MSPSPHAMGQEKYTLRENFSLWDPHEFYQSLGPHRPPVDRQGPDQSKANPADMHVLPH